MNRLWSLVNYVYPYGGEKKITVAAPPEKTNPSNLELEKCAQGFPSEIRSSILQSYSKLPALLNEGELSELVFRLHGWHVFASYSPSLKEILKALSSRDTPNSVSVSWLSIVVRNKDSEDIWYGHWTRSSARNPMHFVAVFPRYLNQYALAGGRTDLPIFLKGEADIDLKSFCLNKDPSLREINPFNPQNVEERVLLGGDDDDSDISEQLRNRTLLGHFVFESYKTDPCSLSLITASLKQLRSEVRFCKARVEEMMTSFAWDVLKAFCTADLPPAIAADFLEQLPKFKTEAEMVRRHGIYARLLFCPQSAIKYITCIESELDCDMKALLVDSLLQDRNGCEDEIFQANLETLRSFSESLPQPQDGKRHVNVDPHMFRYPAGDVEFYLGDDDDIRARLTDRNLGEDVPRGPISEVIETLVTTRYQKRCWGDQ